MIKKCEFCGKEFNVPDNVHGRKRRFCNTSCSAKWRMNTFGPVKVSEEGKKHQSESMKSLWDRPEFRENNHKRMTENNPVYQDGVVAKAHKTRLKNGSYHNNFRFGNGRISEYENIVKDYIEDFDFLYNYPIPTKLARDAFPKYLFPTSYKPDFVNLEKKLCIEVDGPQHMKEIDEKKDFCLNYLGFTVYRFTHEQIRNGEFFKEFDKLWENS